MMQVGGFRLDLVACVSVSLAIGVVGAATAAETGATAYDPWREQRTIAPPADEETGATEAPSSSADAAQSSTDQADVDFSALSSNPDIDSKKRLSTRPAPAAKEPSATWSRNDRANGTSAVTVKSAISPYWDAHIGADLSVVRPSGPQTTFDTVSGTMSSESTPKNSSGSAFASITTAGVPYLWDKTSIEARMDPTADQSRLGATLSKSLPIWNDQFSLMLQNGYRLTEQMPLPLAGGATANASRTVEVDRLAKFSITQSGTSLIAGQTLSSTDDKWLAKVGAEQKLFGDVSISGTVNETSSGVPNKTLSAGYKKTW